ncbi:hypothetical protein TPAU25S_00039 [Tsukamurella paurometabola]
MPGSTVVGVIPASRIGLRPVSSVNRVESTVRPSGNATSRGPNSDQASGSSGIPPGENRFRAPRRVVAGTSPTPRPRAGAAARRVARSSGPRSISQRAPLAIAASTSATQSTGSTSTAAARRPAFSASRPQRSAHSVTSATPSASAGWWKPMSTGTSSNLGANAAPPVSLSLRCASSVSATDSQYSRKPLSSLGVPVSTNAVRLLRTASTGPQASKATVAVKSARSCSSLS